ncbi:MAG: phenylalanine--tRNA ligase subunit alpha [Deltaproteobacteria bacterium]|nr:phenylalanine--tRNA ligase subunit alpha [Deltaproteobacteria bacterium]
MSDQLSLQANDLASKAREALLAAGSEADLSRAKADYLGKQGSIAALLKQIPTLEPDARRTAGRAINEAKKAVEGLFAQRLAAIKDAALGAASDAPVDVTLPGRVPWSGHLHPITRAWRDITDIFTAMGYSIEEGPQVETDWHCFEALNIPKGHPAREMQDTFYVSDFRPGAELAPGEGVVLRTHTSPVQVRTMLRSKPPIRMICPGTVYRRDNDLTHTPMFHQVEGLVVDENITLADLKGTLAEFARAYFGPGTKIRFRPSYFPFTEPSAEVDVTCAGCGGKGCRICKGTGWLEVLGSGMVDPLVFDHQDADDYDSSRVQGFAFGMGIDRLAMLKYGIDDLRILFENDVRMLEQF